MNEFDEINAQWEAHRRRQAQANEANRQAVFDALTALGIENIEISFDGFGDSGQIDEITVTGGKGCLTGSVSVEWAPWNGENRSRTCALADAVEELCYGLLRQEHDGWENNDGACGQFVFDAAQRTIALEFNGRYTAYDTSTHTFGEA